MKEYNFFNSTPIIVFLDGSTHTVGGYVVEAGALGYQFVDTKYYDHLVIFTNTDLLAVFGFVRTYLDIR